jgi:hypothetical protein
MFFTSEDLKRWVPRLGWAHIALSLFLTAFALSASTIAFVTATAGLILYALFGIALLLCICLLCLRAPDRHAMRREARAIGWFLTAQVLFLAQFLAYVAYA